MPDSSSHTRPVATRGGIAGTIAILFFTSTALSQSLDAVNSTVSRSLVSIHKLDATGHKLDAAGRSDTFLGFVIAPNQVATAFQAIDATLSVNVIFPDGRKGNTHEVWACDRLKDWALLKVDTGNTPALPRVLGNAGADDRYLIFNGTGTAMPVLGTFDVAGRRTLPMFGDRIQLRQPLSPEAVGGPLLTSAGLVAGIVGGSITPGSRPVSQSEIAAIPISAVPLLSSGKPARLEVLVDSGILTPPLIAFASVVSGGTARSITKNANGMTANDATEFSHRDTVAWIYTLWQKKDKNSKGEVSTRIYDARNKLLVEITPQNIVMQEAAPLLVDFKVALQKFTAGSYRVDVLWNDKPAWRTFFTMID
jgi:hypothetical protein